MKILTRFKTYSNFTKFSVNNFNHRCRLHSMLVFIVLSYNFFFGLPGKIGIDLSALFS